MRLVILATCFFFSIPAFCQDKADSVRSKGGVPVTKGFIIKTNVLNAIARRPMISGEVFLGSKSSLELSYVSGIFEQILWLESYKYKGMLLRAKFFLNQVERPGVASYFGVYLGTMRKSVRNERDPLFSDPYVISYTRNSLRSGVTFGGQYLAKSRLVLDMQASFGAGRFLNYKNPTYRSGPRGYFDLQYWFCIGYLF